jgi:pilus assembly protein FimV
MQTAASKAAETAKAIGVGIVGPDLVQPAATTPTPQQGFGAPGPVGGQGAPGMTGAPGAAGSTGAAGAPGAGGLFTAPGTSQTISSPAIDSISRGGSGSASFASPTVTMPNYSASDFSNATTSNQELAKMAADLASKKPPEPKK